MKKMTKTFSLMAITTAISTMVFAHDMEDGAGIVGSEGLCRQCQHQSKLGRTCCGARTPTHISHMCFGH